MNSNEKRLNKLIKKGYDDAENSKYMMMKIYPDGSPDYIDEEIISIDDEKEYYHLEFIDEDSELYYLYNDEGTYRHTVYHCYVRNKFYLLIVYRSPNSSVLEDITNKYDWERVFQTYTLKNEYIVDGYHEYIIRYKKTSIYRHYKGSDFYDGQYKPTLVKVEKNDENIEKMKNMSKKSKRISTTITRISDEEFEALYQSRKQNKFELICFTSSKIIRLSDVN